MVFIRDRSPALLWASLDFQLTVQVVIVSYGDRAFDDVKSTIRQVGMGSNACGKHHTQAMVTGIVVQPGFYFEVILILAEGQNIIDDQLNLALTADHFIKLKFFRDGHIKPDKEARQVRTIGEAGDICPAARRKVCLVIGSLPVIPAISNVCNIFKGQQPVKMLPGTLVD